MKRLLLSFKYAFFGFLQAFKTEQNLRIHCVSAILVFALSIRLHLSKMEWIIILLLIGGMFALELMNTAIERTVDLVTKDFHPLAKQAKDIAAASVLIFSIIAAIIGMMIFLPKIASLFLSFNGF